MMVKARKAGRRIVGAGRVDNQPSQIEVPLQGALSDVGVLDARTRDELV